MNQHPHYMSWMKNKYIVNPHFQNPMNEFDNSWEERAFANDVAFIWPPRSYSCSFCKRKFRSAQALGGHMNVHRRDRARLKLSPNSQNEPLSTNQNHPLSPNPNFLSLSNSCCILLDPNTGRERNVSPREDPILVGDDEGVNLSIGLNLVVHNHNDGVNNSKRHKTNVLPTPLFLEPCFKGLDLELRLGDSPKPK